MMASLAWAQETGAVGGGGNSGWSALLMQLPMLALIGLIFYFLIIQPERKRRQQLKAMLDQIKKGDKVVTSSGIWGTVSHLGKNTVTLQIADNTKVKIQREFIARLRTEDEE